MTSIKDLSYENQQIMESMKNQLIIVLVNRLGGSVDIPVSEIDATGRVNLMMSVNHEDRMFRFEVKEKK